ncbi:XRE family transcriptional regulator [Sphingomonas sp. Leaf407]|uniref:helix-turn-helix domain-containing protein n=1 Tax=unclassified Sphingomonas TaxID=196159 RepID=UPI0006FAE90F|nr:MULTISPECIES: helix-turn-helix transcriptional regulator [unclassified Sphingomonas]KQN39407.1 XRE family transcriptional regulator [Sphingomonas sp. Leaf42]KQT28683.1 XRE family transcriptional regulator [Sphingomonas sp. Leaf407]
MITAIREVRRARRLTLEEVAARCVPPTTAQTIGRLETGTRTVSVGWLNRIALALEVEAADLVRLPDRADIAVAAILDAAGVTAPRRQASVVPPRPDGDLVAVVVDQASGDYRSGDTLWCRRLAPPAFAQALGRDVLVPMPAGSFLFGRLLGLDPDRLTVLPIGTGALHVLAVTPWLAVAEQLVRKL